MITEDLERGTRIKHEDVPMRMLLMGKIEKKIKINYGLLNTK